jgi:hypothetical protein
MPEFALLHQFKNLPTLRTTEIENFINVEFYRFLSQSTVRLKAFETEAGIPYSADTLLNLLRSPVLHNVHCLRLGFHDWLSDYTPGEHIYEGFIKAIAKLPALETLKLIEFPLHADWIQHFRNSPRLKCVRWEYPESWKYRNSRPAESDLGGLEEALRNILTRFGDEVPRVRIKCWEYERRYRRPDRASEVYRSVEYDSDDGI